MYSNSKSFTKGELFDVFHGNSIGDIPAASDFDNGYSDDVPRWKAWIQNIGTTGISFGGTGAYYDSGAPATNGYVLAPGAEVTLEGRAEFLFAYGDASGATNPQMAILVTLML